MDEASKVQNAADVRPTTAAPGTDPPTTPVEAPPIVSFDDVDELLRHRQGLQGVVYTILERQLEPAHDQVRRALATLDRLNHLGTAPQRVRIKVNNLEVEYLGNPEGVKAARALAKSSVEDAMSHEARVMEKYNGLKERLARVNEKIAEAHVAKHADPKPPIAAAATDQQRA